MALVKRNNNLALGTSSSAAIAGIAGAVTRAIFNQASSSAIKSAANQFSQPNGPSGGTIKPKRVKQQRNRKRNGAKASQIVSGGANTIPAQVNVDGNIRLPITMSYTIQLGNTNTSAGTCATAYDLGSQPGSSYTTYSGSILQTYLGATFVQMTSAFTKIQINQMRLTYRGNCGSATGGFVAIAWCPLVTPVIPTSIGSVANNAVYAQGDVKGQVVLQWVRTSKHKEFIYINSNAGTTTSNSDMSYGHFQLYSSNTNGTGSLGTLQFDIKALVYDVI